MSAPRQVMAGPAARRAWVWPLLFALLLAADARASEADPGRRDEPPSPFAATPEMRHLARRVTAVPGGTDRRVEALVDLIFAEKGGLGFQYRRHPTLTAAEAFERREGNCLTLVNLFVALAREVGMEAEFVEVEDYEAFYRYGGAIVRSNHVVAGVPQLGDLLTVDFLPDRPKRYRRLAPISDRRATAHHYKAVATEAMLAGDLERAAELFGLSFEADADFAETWNNYAILLRRRGDAAGALEALEKARALAPDLLPALENLARLHRSQGRAEEADRIDARILELKTANPFYLLELAIQRLDAGELAEAKRLAERARHHRPDIPDVYLALGRIELAQGNHDRADELFEQARKKSADYSERFQSAVQEKISRLLEGS